MCIRDSLNTVKSAYSKGTRGSHCDNGHLYSFGNTQESIFRKVKGAKPQGTLSDGYFNHSTGTGYIEGKD